MIQRGGSFAQCAAAALLVAAATAVRGDAAPASDPRFLTGPSSLDPLEIAQGYLRDHHEDAGLTQGDLESVVTDRYATRHNGLTHIYLQQTLDGIKVHHGILGAHVDRQGRIIAFTHRWVKGLAELANVRKPVVTASEAVMSAALDRGLTSVLPPEVLGRTGGAEEGVTFAAAALSLDPIPVRLMYLRVPSGGVRLVWDLMLRPDDEHAWEMQVDAVTGEVLRRFDLVLRDSYKVYAWPAESPNHVTGPLPLPPADGRETVTQSAAHPVASPFGWHDLNGVAGADTTNTTGNNVSAQTDLDANNFFSGADVRPSSATRDFIHSVNFAMEPADYRAALVTNVFYWTNVTHDIHHRYGFDEPAGNFQGNNYMRGGLGNDAVQADAQDGSGTDNANFTTFAEGTAPRMQMYIWTAPPNTHVNAPASIVGDYASAAAAFGSQLTATGVTADVQLVSGGAVPEEGCSALSGFVAGRIALIKRGSCEFGVKVLNAQNAGAVAAIVYNNQGDTLVSMGPGAVGGSVTIPSVFVTQSSGETIRNALTGNTVNATLRKLAPNRDSDFDNGVILHEYGHGVSNRLTGGPQTVNCLQNQQQGGEGWSDWWALTLTARPNHTSTQLRGIASYLVFEDPPALNLGIRPYPYSTDMTVNPLTYGDLRTGTLSVPHGVGSVWATALWDMYWAIVDGVPSLGLPGEGFRQNLYDLTAPLAGNQIALQLVMDGLKLQPCNPSFLDARDAILAADQVNNAGDHQCHIWYAFARRGMGTGALDGNGGLLVTEDFTMPAACSTGPIEAGESAGLVVTISPSLNLTLTWGDSCVPTDDNYAVYQGVLGNWYSHAPLLCTTGGMTSVTFPAPVGNVYYLIVPRNALREGSYGRASDGTPRPALAGSCALQQAAPTCP